ncbi:MAG TPA: RluA family pseudouridine synthase [Candidatus Binataceae bacterium]|jgi:23S rRNA pseudouridine1911/1915/1917 synthase|nr:RluA family pseudouridine synthase [Candidatus Binataceae bacterium]
MERLDLYLVRHGDAVSRRRARDLIGAGVVLVNGRRCRKGRTVTAADTVEVLVPTAPAALAPNSDLALEILYRDQDILVVNKPGLLPCHPLRYDDRHTLMNAVAARFPQTTDVGAKPQEGGLVHRLDNGTSGAVMVALTEAGFARLRAALRNNQIVRSYRTLVQGAITHSLELDAPIAHHPRNRRKMIVVHDPRMAAKLNARPALTIVKPLETVGGFTLAEVIPRTGNRHQIRVHLADAGFPIAGDELYGGPPIASLQPGRFFLHLAELRIPREHASAPASEGGAITVVAPLATDLRNCLTRGGR